MTYARRALLLFSLMVPAWLAAPAQSVRTHVSADSVYVGERFTLSIAVEHAAQLRPVFPSARDSVFGELSVLGSRPAAARTLPSGLVLDSIAYEVAAFALDSMWVPSVSIRFTGATDSAVVRTDSLLIGVRSVVPDSTKAPKDVTDVLAFPKTGMIGAVVGLVLILLVAGAAFILYRRRQRPVVQQAPHEVVTPAMRALRALDALAAVDLAVQANVEPFYTTLAEVLRGYLEAQAGFPALEVTTAELVALMEASRHRAEAARVGYVLQLADLVKFAGQVPEPVAGAKALETARTVVHAVERYAPAGTVPVE